MVLKQSDGFFEILAQNAPIGIFFAGSDGVAQYVNQTLAKAAGYPVEELIGTLWYEKIHPGDRDRVTAQWLANVQSVEPWNVEFRFQKPDGTVTWVQGQTNPQINTDGKATSHVGTIMDITEHKQLQETLRESESKLRAFFRNSDTDINIKSAEGRYVLVSRRFEQTFGLAEGEAHGKLPNEIFPEAFAELVHKQDLAILQTGKLVQQEDVVPGSDPPITLLVNKFPITDESGKVTGIGVFSSDITELKMAEKFLHESHDNLEEIVEDRTSELRVAKETAEKANRAKSEFLSSMSHELRTPMNAILGFAQLLDINSSEPLSEKQNSFVNHIIKSGKHLMVLIDQVLELNKIEAGKLSIDFADIPAHIIIDESLRLIQSRAQQDGIEFVDKIPRDNLPVLRTDGTRLTQVLLNLLSNAVKYNCKNGTVTLSCEETSANMLRISVVDTGMGIPEDKQQFLFTPFERLGRETGVIEGTGIGLTITRQVIELLCGKVGFHSEENKGSTFWIDVPMSRKQSTSVMDSI